MWRNSLFGNTADGIAFGECKTFDTFKDDDFLRMRHIMKSFPGAIIIFATFREKLTNAEKKELKKIVKEGRQYWKNEQPINPVMILTGTELSSMFKPPYCWEDEDDKKYNRYSGMLGICNMTQQRYLGLPSWQEDWEKELRKKKKV